MRPSSALALPPRRAACRALALLLGAAAGLVRAQAARPLITVMLEELPPYSFADAAGQAQGYSVELARELLARARLEARFEFSSWPRVERRGRQEANVLLPAIVRLPEREAQFFWLGQISARRGMLYRLKSRPDVQPHSITELKGYRTAVIKDDVSERELLALGLEVGPHLDRSADYPSLLRKFFAGRSELLAFNQFLMPVVLKQYGYDPQALEPVLKFSDSRPSMALSLPTEPALCRQLQLLLDGMRKDGSMAAIAARYPAITLD